MTTEKKIKEVETHLSKIKYALENLMPMYAAVDRRKRVLELYLKIAEDQLIKLQQGQLELGQVYKESEEVYNKTELDQALDNTL